jgi:histidinol-phosphate aminotransferase
MHLYPDGGAYDLKRALSGHLEIPADRLVITNGSNEAIELLGHVFLQPGHQVVMADGAFIVYRLVAQLFGADTVAVPMRDHTHDLDAMADAVTADTRLVFVANPNNPTGTMVSGDALDRFLDRLPDHVVPVLDEAYIELVEEEQRPASLEWVRSGRAMVVLRTFSKAYGLAGLRIGYAMAPAEAIDLLQRVRQPFNVNAMALAAARAALADHAFLQQSRALIRDGLAQLSEGLQVLGLRFVPSVANFLLVQVGDGSNMFEQLQRRGVIVRPMAAYGMADYVRVTVGTHDQNQRFIRELERVLA